jgi:hypothetical protein
VQAAVHQFNLQLAAAVAQCSMAEPKSRVAAEKASTHAKNAAVCYLLIWMVLTYENLPSCFLELQSRIVLSQASVCFI